MFIMPVMSPYRSMMDDPEPTARIIAAFERLQAEDYPIPEGTIPYRHSIPMIARQLTIMRRVDTDTRRARKAYDDITKLAKDAVAFVKRLEQLADGGLQDGPRETVFAALHAWEPLSAFVEVAERERTLDAGMKGRPRKSAPDNIVAFLYQNYERITGHDPTLIVRGSKTGGEFLTLASEVFKALGLKDSPEAAVRRVMEKKAAEKSKKLHMTT